MLIFTNRRLNAATDESAFERRFEPGATRLAVASVQATASGGWAVAGHLPDVADADALNQLLPLFSAARPILVYLHGNGNPPAECFARCALLASLYGVEVIGFSWTSEGFLSDGNELPGLAPALAATEETELKSVTASNRSTDGIQRLIRRYHQAQTNAKDSVDALARFLRLLGTARLHANVQPFTLAAHSLGAHLLQYTLDVQGAGESLGTAHNVVLLAACVRATGHRDWLANIRPKGQVFVTYNQADAVLAGAYIADGSQALKLGTTPGPALLRSVAVRYICFSGGQVGWGGHSYFVQSNMPAKTRALFARLFGSARDISPGEHPRRAYLFGCDDDGLTCYMGRPEPDPDTIG